MTNPFDRNAPAKDTLGSFKILKYEAFVRALLDADGGISENTQQVCYEFDCNPRTGELRTIRTGIVKEKHRLMQLLEFKESPWQHYRLVITQEDLTKLCFSRILVNAAMRADY